jgi:hypothetical protein
MTKINYNIIQKVYQWDGMVNQYHIGYINYMVLVKNINVRFVAVQVTGVEEHLINTFRSGDMLTE